MSTRERGPLSPAGRWGWRGESAAAAAGPAFARGDAPKATMAGLVDPRDQYPKPPFKRQSQPWPGTRQPHGPPTRSR